MLDSQLPDTSLGLPDVATPNLVPFVPGVEIPLEVSTPLEIIDEVLNHQTPISSNPILYQNSVTGIQNFTNHTQCIEYVYNYIIISLKSKYRFQLICLSYQGMIKTTN